MPKRTKKTTATTPGGTEIALVGAAPKATRKRAAKAKTTEPMPAAKVETKSVSTDSADPGDEEVVFAIRISRRHRDLIHEVAGSGKATKFVRGLAVAAANGDIDEVHRIVGEVARRK